jgi:hypothetical protein
MSNLPFAKQWKLHASELLYDLLVQDGESVNSGFWREKDPSNSVESEVSIALSQLSTLSPGRVSPRGSSEFIRYRNAMMVIISVATEEQAAYSWRVFSQLPSKVFSLAGFVFGTMILNVILLALPMADSLSSWSLLLVYLVGLFLLALSPRCIDRTDDTHYHG